MSSESLWSNHPDRDLFPDTVSVEGESFFDYGEGGFKKVYRSYGDEIAIMPIQGETVWDKALHCAVIDQSNESLRESGLETATEYSVSAAAVNDEYIPCLIGKDRDDLYTEKETDELIEGNPEIKKQIYDEVFLEVRKLYEEGEIPLEPIEFVYQTAEGGIGFQTTNFRLNTEYDPVILDTGELHREIHLGISGLFETPLIEMDEELGYADQQDFEFDSPYRSLDEYMETKNIEERAEEILRETGLK